MREIQIKIGKYSWFGEGVVLDCDSFYRRDLQSLPVHFAMDFRLLEAIERNHSRFVFFLTDGMTTLHWGGGGRVRICRGFLNVTAKHAVRTTHGHHPYRDMQEK